MTSCRTTFLLPLDPAQIVRYPHIRRLHHSTRIIHHRPLKHQDTSSLLRRFVRTLLTVRLLRHNPTTVTPNRFLLVNSPLLLHNDSIAVNNLFLPRQISRATLVVVTVIVLVTVRPLAII